MRQRGKSKNAEKKLWYESWNLVGESKTFQNFEKKFRIKKSEFFFRSLRETKKKWYREINSM